MAGMALDELVADWRALPLDGPPYLFPKDQTLLRRSDKQVVTFKDFASFANSDALGDRKDTRFHLGLLPVPYVGDIQQASIFILTLNPSLEPLDYFGGERVPELREAIVQNLRQEDLDSEFPFFALNPRFSWDGSFRYWEGKLHEIVQKIREVKGLGYGEALSHMAKSICCLQLVPYYSRVFGNERLLSGLASTKLITRYVQEELAPRAKKKQVLLIVVRQKTSWGVNEQDAVVYKGNESRGASLSLKSRGGKAIARWLGLPT